MTRSSLVVCLVIIQFSLVLCNNGVMRVHSENGGWKSHFCIGYNEDFHHLPEVADQAATYRLTDLSSTDGCQSSDFTPATVNGTVVIVDIVNCTTVTKAYWATAAGARGIVMAGDVLYLPSTQSTSITNIDYSTLQQHNKATANHYYIDYRNITISVVSIRWSDVRLIQAKSHGNDLYVLLYRPVFNKFDGNIVLFFFLSVLVITVGGFWSGKAKYEKVMAQYMEQAEKEETSDEQAALNSPGVGGAAGRASEQDTAMGGLAALSTDTRGEGEIPNKNVNRTDESVDIPVVFTAASTHGNAVGGGNGLEDKENDDAVVINLKTETTSADECTRVDDADKKEKKKCKPNSSLITVITLFVSAVTTLLLMYFFYDYMVYVAIVGFALAGASCLYSCTKAWIWERLVPWSAQIPANRIPLFRKRPLYRNIILGLLCLGVGIFWFVERHASFAWVIQDFLGVVCCINVVKSLKLPNLKICTILLVCMFIYDIFFVFVTPTIVSPFISKKGNSIMEKVATGVGSKTNEKVPWVFLSPPFTSNDIYSCSTYPFSVLGFGDTIIPGMLIAHNYAFDLFVHSKRVYYIATIIAYIVGLLITYVALAFMEIGQPALLYLVPCTLFTTFVIGCIRGEVGLLWRGVHVVKDQTKSAGDDLAGGEARNADAVRDPADSADNVSTSAVAVDENRHHFEGDQMRLVPK